MACEIPPTPWAIGLTWSSWGSGAEEEFDAMPSIPMPLPTIEAEDRFGFARASRARGDSAGIALDAADRGGVVGPDRSWSKMSLIPNDSAESPS